MGGKWTFLIQLFDVSQMDHLISIPRLTHGTICVVQKKHVAGIFHNEKSFQVYLTLANTQLFNVLFICQDLEGEDLTSFYLSRWILGLNKYYKSGSSGGILKDTNT